MQIFAWIISIGFLVWAIDEYARDAWRDGLAERSWRDEIRKAFLALPISDYLRMTISGRGQARLKMAHQSLFQFISGRK